MKKLIAKDKKLRLKLKTQEKQYHVLKSIFQNTNLLNLVRWNAYIQLKTLGKNNSFVSLSPRCVYTMNKKRFNSSTSFSRYVLLKLIRSGKLSGFRKASW